MIFKLYTVTEIGKRELFVDSNVLKEESIAILNKIVKEYPNSEIYVDYLSADGIIGTIHLKEI